MIVYDVLVDGVPLTREELVKRLTADTPDGPELDRARLGIVDAVAQWDVTRGFVDGGAAASVVGSLVTVGFPLDAVKVREREDPDVSLEFPL